MLRRLSAVLRQLSLFDPPPTPSAPGPAARPPRVEAPAPAPSSPDAPRSGDPSGDGFPDLCRGPYAHVRVEVGARLRDSWKVTWNRREEALSLRVPPALAAAPWEVKEAALRWAVLVARRTRRASGDSVARLERRRLEAILRDYLQGPSGAGEGSPHHARRLASNRRRLARLEPKGSHHDLNASLAAVNAEYFGGALEARITWASRLGGLSTHRIAEDGEGRPYHLITISRGYDSPEVTPEILGGVVYHECLHIVIPPRKENGRRVVHGGDFRERERQYRFFAEWRDWHRHGLPRVLRRMLREERKGRALL